MEVNVYHQLSGYCQALKKKSSFESDRRKKFNFIRNNWRVRKWWQNFYFWANFPF